MQIIYCRPIEESACNGTVCLATIDLEFSPELRLYGLRLLRMPDGQHRLYAPQSGKRRVASFAPDMARKLTAMALRAWEGLVDDQP